MEKLIQFSTFKDQLSKKELGSFFCELVNRKDFDHSFIFQCIFNQIYQNIQNSDENKIDDAHRVNFNIIDTMNDTMKDIMNKRKKSNDKQIITSKSKFKSFTFYSLPPCMVNEIGSWLTLVDLIHFENTNKKHFVALRYPHPALRSIGYDDLDIGDCNSDWIDTFMNLEDDLEDEVTSNRFAVFSRFAGVSAVKLDSSYFDLKIHLKGKIFNSNLKKLYLDAIEGHFEDCIRTDCFNYSNLEHLGVDGGYFGISKEEETSLGTLVIGYKKLKSLSLRNCSTNFNLENICDKLPNLIAVHYEGADLNSYKPFADAVSQKIESLHIDDPNMLMKLTSNSSFKGYPNLKEFCFEGTKNNVAIAIHEILKSATKLEHINIKFLGDNMKMNKMQKKNFKKAMEDIWNIPTLKMVEFDPFYDAELLSELLNKLELYVATKKRKTLKIVINRIGDKVDMKVLRLVNSLIVWIDQHFCLILYHDKGCKLKSSMVNRLKQIVNVQISKPNSNQIKYMLSTKGRGDIVIQQRFVCYRHASCTPTNY